MAENIPKSGKFLWDQDIYFFPFMPVIHSLTFSILFFPTGPRPHWVHRYSSKQLFSIFFYLYHSVGDPRSYLLHTIQIFLWSENYEYPHGLFYSSYQYRLSTSQIWINTFPARLESDIIHVLQMLIRDPQEFKIRSIPSFSSPNLRGPRTWYFRITHIT